jgi:hypothetical protein
MQVRFPRGFPDQSNAGRVIGLLHMQTVRNAGFTQASVCCARCRREYQSRGLAILSRPIKIREGPPIQIGYHLTVKRPNFDPQPLNNCKSGSSEGGLKRF